MLQSRSKGLINVETEANIAYSATIILPQDSPESEKEETPETDANIAYGETDANIAYNVVDEGTRGTDTNIDYEAIEAPPETDANTMTRDEDKPETVVNISYNVIR